MLATICQKLADQIVILRYATEFLHGQTQGPARPERFGVPVDGLPELGTGQMLAALLHGPLKMARHKGNAFR